MEKKYLSLITRITIDNDEYIRSFVKEYESAAGVIECCLGMNWENDSCGEKDFALCDDIGESRHLSVSLMIPKCM